MYRHHIDPKTVQHRMIYDVIRGLSEMENIANEIETITSNCDWDYSLVSDRKYPVILILYPHTKEDKILVELFLQSRKDIAGKW